MSNTSASLYVGFSVFFLMEVFLFFSRRPSQIREAFTYGSGGGTRETRKMRGARKERGVQKEKRVAGGERREGREGIGIRSSVEQREREEREEGGGGAERKR